MKFLHFFVVFVHLNVALFCLKLKQLPLGVFVGKWAVESSQKHRRKKGDIVICEAAWNS